MGHSTSSGLGAYCRVCTASLPDDHHPDEDNLCEDCASTLGWLEGRNISSSESTFSSSLSSSDSHESGGCDSASDSFGDDDDDDGNTGAGVIQNANNRDSGYYDMDDYDDDYVGDDEGLVRKVCGYTYPYDLCCLT